MQAIGAEGFDAGIYWATPDKLSEARTSRSWKSADFNALNVTRHRRPGRRSHYPARISCRWPE